MFERRGIEYDKNKKISELFNLNRAKVYGLQFDGQQEIKIISTPEKIVERINHASVIYQLVANEASSKEGYSERRQLSGHPSIHLYFKQIYP
ncbi:hypothetical protein [Okeania sp.]|uniref:hypothetical protein n=1 Tax=Okeania sp. TaxID=3100323 RepID=UPI002B4B6CE1|nr:hypothetical protein [Okeania sp.]MEB3341423.1 hypothetical protein [Okeania sp.]